jgi:hypothetical protein
MIDRPIEEVFAFLADGENDPKFSSRVIEIAKTTDGPPAVGTVYANTVRDAGVKTKREFKLTEFDSPTGIRWTEITKNQVVVAEERFVLIGDRSVPVETGRSVAQVTGRRVSPRVTSCDGRFLDRRSASA